MALFFVGYDLRKQRDYTKLSYELKKFGAIRILQSSWCFKRAGVTSTGLRDYFKQFIDVDDGLCVSEVTAWATSGTLSNPSKLA